MNSNDLVKDILKRDVDEQDRILKSTEVIKPCPVDIDLGNLLVWDPNVIDQQAYKYVRTYIENFVYNCLFRENRDEYIKNTMRDNMQLLVNALWQVPIERHDNAIVAILPDAKTIVPREKPVSYNFFKCLN
jgi:regulator of ribosome biosynthesis